MTIDLTGLPRLSRRAKRQCLKWNMQYGHTLTYGKGNRALRRRGGVPHDPPIGHSYGMNRSEFARHFGFRHPEAK